MRSMLSLPFKDAIVIFDEAHNIENVCEELTCFELTINDLFLCYTLLNGLCNVYQDKEAKEWSVDKNRITNKAIDSKLVKLFVLKLIDVIESYNVKNNKNKFNVEGAGNNLHVFRMAEMFNLISAAFNKLKDEKELIRERKHNDLLKNFSNSGFSPNFAENLDLIKKILETCILDLPEKSKLLNKLFESLEKISNAFKISAEYDEDFFMFIIDEYQESSQKNQRKLGFWCFNPAYAFKEFMNEKPRSIILASGTLTPMNTFDNELQIDFPIKLENDHVISKTQAMVGIITEGVDGRVLNFKFENRNDYTLLASIGKSLLAIEKIITGGILVFFPSYSLLTKTIKLWKDSKEDKRFSRKMFIEPKSQGKFHATFDGYLQEIRRNKKALFLGVCRGKFAEGIDFTDDAARAVILIGIPYPQYYDPKVILKKEYMTAKKNKKLSDIGGNQWYNLQASRATNQAVGRVIRHAEDCGIVLLFDERFRNNKTIQLSRWLNIRKKVYMKFDELEVDINQGDSFFNTN